MAKEFTLGRTERLKSRKSIELLFSQGKKIAIPKFKVLFMINNQQADSSLTFAAAVSTKNFRKAVDRNRVKRLVREAWRLQKNPLKEKLAENNVSMNVFVIYTGKELPEYNDVFASINTALTRLVKTNLP